VIWNAYGRSSLKEARPLVPSNLKLVGCWKLCRNLSTVNELNGLEQGGASPIRGIFETLSANFSSLLRAKFAQHTFYTLGWISLRRMRRGRKSAIMTVGFRACLVRFTLPSPAASTSGGSWPPR
jgi:hypothetical protein